MAQFYEDGQPDLTNKSDKKYIAYGIDHSYDPKYKKPVRNMSTKDQRLFFLKNNNVNYYSFRRPHSVSNDLTAASTKSNNNSDDFTPIKRCITNPQIYAPIKVIQSAEDQINQTLEF